MHWSSHRPAAERRNACKCKGWSGPRQRAVKMRHCSWFGWRGIFLCLVLLPKSAARWHSSAQHKHIINSGSRDPGWWDYRWLFTSVPLFLSAFTSICLFLRLLDAGLIIFPGHLLLSPLISSRRYCFARYNCSHFLFAFSLWKYCLMLHCLAACLACAALRSTAARHSRVPA